VAQGTALSRGAGSTAAPHRSSSTARSCPGSPRDNAGIVPPCSQPPGSPQIRDELPCRLHILRPYPQLDHVSVLGISPLSGASASPRTSTESRRLHHTRQQPSFTHRSIDGEPDPRHLSSLSRARPSSNWACCSVAQRASGRITPPSAACAAGRVRVPRGPRVQLRRQQRVQLASSSSYGLPAPSPGASSPPTGRVAPPRLRRPGSRPAPSATGFRWHDGRRGLLRRCLHERDQPAASSGVSSRSLISSPCSSTRRWCSPSTRTACAPVFVRRCARRSPFAPALPPPAQLCTSGQVEHRH